MFTVQGYDDITLKETIIADNKLFIEIYNTRRKYYPKIQRRRIR